MNTPIEKKISNVLPVIGRWPRFAKIALAKHLFKGRNGYLYDFYHPNNFIEKTWTYTVLYENPSFSKYVDKYVFKDTITKILGDKKYVIPAYGIYENISEVIEAWDTLPETFYIKSTVSGNGRNIRLIEKKSDVDKQSLFNEIKKWFNPHNTLINSIDRSYRDLKPRVLAEKYMHDLDSDALRDYKFYCFDGVPFCLHTRLFDKDCDDFSRTFFDMEWNKIDATISHHPSAKSVSRPVHFDEMKRIASVLSAGFPFARVDFYDSEDNPIVGEVTLGYPSSDIEPAEFNRLLGEKMVIPQESLIKNAIFKK